MPVTPRNDITAARVRELLVYEPTTGDLRWRWSRKGCRAAAVAGCLRDDGYWVIRLDRALYLSHRIIWLWMTGEWPPELVDHRDRDPSDNRWERLREASHAQNQRNMDKAVRAASGIKGAYYDKRRNRWWSQIEATPNRVWLGYFPSAQAAGAAYAVACDHFHEQFAIPAYTRP